MTLAHDGAVVRCSFCSNPIHSTRNAYRRIGGWEREREQGGTNHVVLREPKDEWACIHCINKLQSGVAVGQETLLV